MKDPQPHSGADRAEAAAFLVLRLNYGLFWVLQSFGKMYDQESRIAAFGNLAVWTRNTADWFAKQTVLPSWLVWPYLRALPFAELAIGLMLLAGLETRRTLLAAALLIVSLNAGLLLQLKHDTVALNTVHLAVLLLALRWARHDRWSLDAFIAPPIQKR